VVRPRRLTGDTPDPPEEPHPKATALPSISNCARPACGRPFVPRRGGGKPQRFCSPRCRWLDWGDKHPRVRLADWAPPKDHPDVG
jgi:endogenous inhibitor of DNA gyrase (YacG/DUF329 family)